MAPLLAVDIGNTTTGFALFEDYVSSDKLLSLLTLSSESLKSTSGRRAGIKAISSLLRNITDKTNSRIPVVVSSVVPHLNDLLAEMLSPLNLCPPFFINSFNNRILSFLEVKADSLGADRIASTAGAYDLYGGPIAVADFGTATTVSVADSRGVFIGGAIMPGLQLMLKYLKDSTAQLPQVDLRMINSPVGRDTGGAMLAGAVIGTAGAVERILKDIEKENGFKLQLVLTGGNASFIKPHMRRRHKIEPSIIYEGLRRIYLRNRP